MAEENSKNYEEDAIRALKLARKGITAGMASEEFQLLLATANVYATLELANALKRSQG